MYHLLPYILTNESTKDFTAKFTKGFIKGLGNTTATLTVLGLLSGTWYIYNNGIYIIQTYNLKKSKKLKKSKIVKNYTDQIQFYENENDLDDCTSSENQNLVDIKKDFVKDKKDTDYKKLFERLF